MFEAYDSSYPQQSKRARGMLTVYVTRNPNGPRFTDPQNYRAVEWEDFPVGDILIDANATDSDSGVNYVLLYFLLKK